MSRHKRTFAVCRVLGAAISLVSVITLHATPSSAITCLSVGYSTADRNTLVQKFDQLSTACSGVSGITASIATIVKSKNDTQLANFLKNYYKGCYHANVPRAMTPLQAKWFASEPYVGADNAFERRLQRALVVAMPDKFIDAIADTADVVTLGALMEGEIGVPAECALRDEVLRVLSVLDTLSDKATLLTPAFADEAYLRFKTLIDEQGAALQLYGISPNPQTYPWLGPMRTVIWRVMRMIKNGRTGGGTLDLTQFTNDIRAWGTFYQKYRDLIIDHGVLVTDGDGFTASDFYVHPIYSPSPYVPHQLGYQQLQIKAIDRLLDLMPPSVVSNVFSVSEARNLGNICYEEETSDRCQIDGADPDEEDVEASFVVGAAGVCTLSSQECSADDECTAANQKVTQRWGPSNRAESRCPILRNDVCPPTYYANNPAAIKSSRPDRCMKFGVNTREFSVAEPGQPQRGILGVFPSDTPLSTDPNRPVRFPRFAITLQHEINHAVEYWKVRRDATLKARHDELIAQACDDIAQYLHPSKTFCGRNGAGCPSNPSASCSAPANEFFAGIANAYLSDTQTLLNLARKRWNDNPSKKEPINQFLFFAGIYSTSTGTPTTISFFYQDRFTNNADYSTTALPPDNLPHGLCQYQTASATAIRDTQGRITSLTAPDGKVHQFGYSGTSKNVTSWAVSP